MKPWMLIAGCAVAGCVGGLAWPPPPIPRAEKQSSAWVLPSPPPRAPSSEDLSTSGLSAIRWDGDRTGAAEGDAVWRFAGIATGTAAVALIDIKGTKELGRYPVGSALPDGSKLSGITRDSITSEQGACRRSYALYHTQTVEASPECGSTAAAKEKESK